MSKFAGPTLSVWQSFYVMVGSSGAALIGIQFVVIALIANMRQRPTADAISAFGTPTVVHLVSALLVSAIMNVPWPSLFLMSIPLSLCGFGGLVYCVIAIRRARPQLYYQPVLEDWLWYALLPCSVYALLFVTAILLSTIGQIAMFVIGTVALTLLLIGIHNSWDSVTHIVVKLDGDTATRHQGET